jgi:hypothetical protein
MSGVPQGNILGPLLFLAYVNDTWRYNNSSTIIRLFADDCIICRKIINHKDRESLLIALNRLGEWAV